MKRKLSKTEEANIKLDKAFYGENHDEPELAPFVNNNNIALVLKSNKNNDKANEDI
ncbi:hypothetical protein [Oceanobacillus sp. CF4.6]|uniref:hypothetical protein n=1 Tax=Oceanobacillus sp. CF4.6 TaxID=3373080 RepID=UPI003EE6F7C0